MYLSSVRYPSDSVTYPEWQGTYYNCIPLLIGALQNVSAPVQYNRGGMGVEQIVAELLVCLQVFEGPQSHIAALKQ